jgi:maltooligosyltrehalose trehalohydrolase
VLFAQNHDQIGNRPNGDRLVSVVSPEQAQLAAALLLLAPGVPLLFMGEEYGEPAPFPYFVDHGEAELTEAVRAGRAREFAQLAGPDGMLDPAAASTFAAALPDRALRHRGTHRHRLALCRALIALRRTNPALARSPRAAARASATSGVLTLVRSHPLDAVVALFNVSPVATGGALPSAPIGWPVPAGEPCWEKLLDARAAEFGGRGDPLPQRCAPGDETSLGPWEFCAYHLSGRTREGR